MSRFVTFKEFERIKAEIKVIRVNSMKKKPFRLNKRIKSQSRILTLNSTSRNCLDFNAETQQIEENFELDRGNNWNLKFV